MNNYKNSNYALNKHSSGIVYKFTDETIEIDLETYLAANPTKKASDFEALKILSDSDYHDEDRATYRQTYKDILCPDVDAITQDGDPSAEESFLDGIALIQENEKYQARIDFAHQILSRLTAIQKQRYVMHKIQGLTIREIAAMEGTFFTSVHESLQAAEKKIKKILSTV